MDYSFLWQEAEKNSILPINQLDPALADCILHGDQIFDHYGGKPPFCLLAYQGHRLLTLERLDDGASVAVHSIVNGTGGYGTGILGGDVGVLSEAMQEGLLLDPCANDEFGNVERYRLVKKIKQMIASHTETSVYEWEITFTSTGTEAMDFAYQMVQLEGFDLLTGIGSRDHRNVIIACRGAWHGWSMAPNQLLDRRQFTEGLPRFNNHQIVFHHYGDIDELEEIFRMHAGKVRAVFVEGILGDGGIIPGSSSWWDRLLDLAKQEEARVVDDEILTCMRTGQFLALPKGKSPDCIALGKGLGFGVFPVSAVAWKKNKLNPRPGIGVRTFNARPLHSRVIKTGLEYIEKKDLFSYSEELGRDLLEQLRALPELYPDVYKAVRGQGLLIGVELANGYGRKGREVRDELIRAGLLTELESGLTSAQLPRNKRINQTIRLTPPLTTPKEAIKAILASFEQAANRLRSLRPMYV